jgi:hypothetical protein
LSLLERSEAEVIFLRAVRKSDDLSRMYGIFALYYFSTFLYYYVNNADAKLSSIHLISFPETICVSHPTIGSRVSTRSLLKSNGMFDSGTAALAVPTYPRVFDGL